MANCARTLRGLPELCTADVNEEVQEWASYPDSEMLVSMSSVSSLTLMSASCELNQAVDIDCMLVFVSAVGWKRFLESQNFGS